MSYQDYCARCGESYDNDNLVTCKGCGGDVCFRCLGSKPWHCVRCSPREERADPPDTGVAAQQA